MYDLCYTAVTEMGMDGSIDALVEDVLAFLQKDLSSIPRCKSSLAFIAFISFLSFNYLRYDKHNLYALLELLFLCHAKRKALTLRTIALLPEAMSESMTSA